jgi:hypothetical protein
MNKTGLMTTVTNVKTKKKYFISTVEEPRVGGWQTAVFRKIFGPVANFGNPAFFLGCFAAERAAYQHERVATIVRDIDPADWGEASRKLSMELIEEDVKEQKAADTEFYAEMSRKFT